VGRYRREAFAELQKQQGRDDVSGKCDAEFFDANNQAATELREKVAELALMDMLRWLDDEEEELSGVEETATDLTKHNSMSSLQASIHGQAKLTYKRYERIAIFDATNSTEKRRQWVLEQCTSPEKRPGKPTGVIFVESICDDQELLQENYRYKTSASPDFKGMTNEVAMADLMQRVKKYEDAYETITNDHHSYIKICKLLPQQCCMYAVAPVLLTKACSFLEQSTCRRNLWSIIYTVAWLRRSFQR
jgi:hypothetical protein